MEHNDISSHSVENPNRNIYLEFNHHGKQFALSTEKVEKNNTDKYAITMLIADSEGIKHGMINGIVKYNNDTGLREFHSGELSNLHINEQGEKGPDYIPGVLQASIVQLLVQGQFDLWVSSSTLLEGGKIMYTALMQHTLLQGKEVALPNGKIKYILEKRN